MTPPVEYQSKELHKAISGLGTDEHTIVEILGIHNNDEVKNIRDVYEGCKNTFHIPSTRFHNYVLVYQSSLEKDLKGDSSGTLKRLFVSLSTVCCFSTT